MYADVSSCILKLKFFFQDTSSTMTAWTLLVALLRSESEMIYLSKKVLPNYFS